MNRAEQRRIIVLNHLESGALINAQAGELLGISKRQLQRLRKAYSEEGAAGLVHGNRGRPAYNAVDAAIAARVVEWARDKYTGFNHQHLTEMLAENHGIELSRPTVRRILLQAGISSPRRRRPPKHRRRRDRYPREGMLLQLDASRHDWLEGRGPYLSLVGCIDDATGRVPSACFREQEDAQGYFIVMRETVSKFGIPMAAYADRHSIFYQGKEPHLRRLSLEEQLAAQREPTQFGRLLNELGVQLIHALSPQAKGRIERLWGTFQDRLASELRLAGAANCEQANQVLRRFLPRHNRRFVVSAQQPETAWVEWPKGHHLDQLFCFKYRRVVLNDNTVRIGQQVIDIPPPNKGRASYAHARVEVQERFDGSLVVYLDGHCIATKVLAEPTLAYRARGKSVSSEQPPITKPKQPQAAPPTGPWRPAKNHPWRRTIAALVPAKAEAS
ncbi:MAG: ISNCY family transposase [Candidatus Dormiibacterota bacterium]